jgi:hypothetical protein
MNKPQDPIAKLAFKIIKVLKKYATDARQGEAAMKIASVLYASGAEQKKSLDTGSSPE